MESRPLNLVTTIADVALEAGVSKATVSNYLNGRNNKISAETCERLRLIIEQLDYTPSLGARRLSARTRSGSVGLLIRRNLAQAFAEPFFAEVFRGVGERFDASGTRGLVLTRPALQESSSETAYLMSLSRGIVDGFLVFDIEEHDATLRLLARRNVPFVAFGKAEDDIPGPCVGTDHAAGVIQAVEWLLQQGHQRFVMAPGAHRLLISQQRELGLLQALKSAGLRRSNASLYDATSNLPPERWLHSLLAQHEGPTAFLLPAAWQGAWQEAVDARPTGWPKVELVLLDCFTNMLFNGPRPGFIEAPTAEVGRRGAEMLDEYITSGVGPRSELFPARFIAPARS